MAEWFPNRPMTDDEVEYISFLCGGSPVETTQQVDNFIRINSEPFLKYSLFNIAVHSWGKDSADTFDIHPAIGARAFARGALLYAGVVAVLTPLTQVPRSESRIKQLVQASEHEMTWLLYEKINDEVPSFCHFMEEIRPGLATTQDSNLHKLAVVGAGLTHFMVSDEVRSYTDAMSLDAEFPELAELEDIFQAIENGK